MPGTLPLAAIIVVVAMTGCAQFAAPSMIPIGTPSASDVKRDRAECEAHAEARAPSRGEPLGQVLQTQAVGAGLGAVVGGLGVAARQGRLQGSSTGTTDVLI